MARPDEVLIIWEDQPYGKAYPIVLKSDFEEVLFVLVTRPEERRIDDGRPIWEQNDLERGAPRRLMMKEIK